MLRIMSFRNLTLVFQPMRMVVILSWMILLALSHPRLTPWDETRNYLKYCKNKSALVNNVALTLSESTTWLMPWHQWPSRTFTAKLIFFSFVGKTNDCFSYFLNSDSSHTAICHTAIHHMSETFCSLCLIKILAFSLRFGPRWKL